MISLTARARTALRPDEVVLVDWHVTGLCCADAGEFSVRAMPRRKLPRKMRPTGASSQCAIYAHPTAWSHLADLDVTIDCRWYGRWRRFVSDLPSDAGLRACMGRLEGNVAHNGGGAT